MRLEFKRALGAAVRALRLRRGLSQEQLGPSQPYISNLESGRWNASIDKIEQLASVLGVHPLTIIVAGYAGTSAEADEMLHRVRTELRDAGI